MSNWIKCSKRLPDFKEGGEIFLESEPVLIFTDNKEIYKARLVELLYRIPPKKEWWIDQQSDDAEPLKMEKITHWQPLPEPPE